MGTDPSFCDAVLLQYSLVSNIGPAPSATQQQSNAEALVRNRESLDGHLALARLGNSRIRGPWLADSAPLCPCTTLSKAVVLANGLYGRPEGSGSVAPVARSDVLVQLLPEGVVTDPAQSIELVATIRRVDCCAVNFTVRVEWQCLVEARDVLPGLLGSGMARHVPGPGLRLGSGALRPGATVALRVWPGAARGAGWAQPITVTRAVAGPAPAAPLRSAVAPRVGAAWRTRFTVSVTPCLPRQHRFFYELGGRRHIILDDIRCSAPATQLPAGVTRVGVCQVPEGVDNEGDYEAEEDEEDEAEEDEPLCSLCDVRVLNGSLSAEAVAAWFGALRALPTLRNWTFEACPTLPALELVPETAERQALKLQLTQEVDWGLEREIDGHAHGSIPLTSLPPPLKYPRPPMSILPSCPSTPPPPRPSPPPVHPPPPCPSPWGGTVTWRQSPPPPQLPSLWGGWTWGGEGSYCCSLVSCRRVIG